VNSNNICFYLSFFLDEKCGTFVQQFIAPRHRSLDRMFYADHDHCNRWRADSDSTAHGSINDHRISFRTEAPGNTGCLVNRRLCVVNTVACSSLQEIASIQVIILAKEFCANVSIVQKNVEFLFDGYGSNDCGVDDRHLSDHGSENIKGNVRRRPRPVHVHQNRRNHDRIGQDLHRNLLGAQFVDHFKHKHDRSKVFAKQNVGLEGGNVERGVFGDSLHYKHQVFKRHALVDNDGKVGFDQRENHLVNQVQVVNGKEGHDALRVDVDGH
jgi:hypothetical protein